MEIEIREVDMDEANEKVTVHFETESGHRFNKVIKIDEETETKAKLKKHVEGLADSIAAENSYDKVTFEFQTNAFFYEPPEGEEAEEEAEPEEDEEAEETKPYTEDDLNELNKDKLTGIAKELEIYEEEMEERSFTKGTIIEKILKAQE